mmetsp:Transcript_21489/g.61217  ORF Transcript_21489/g.61217 Transcript_21489/m.61217 type:complete len:266 (-) Transcript_21489:262-1059(-)
MVRWRLLFPHVHVHVGLRLLWLRVWVLFLLVGVVVEQGRVVVGEAQGCAKLLPSALGEAADDVLVTHTLVGPLGSVGVVAVVHGFDVWAAVLDDVPGPAPLQQHPLQEQVVHGAVKTYFWSWVYDEQPHGHAALHLLMQLLEHRQHTHGLVVCFSGGVACSVLRRLECPGSSDPVLPARIGFLFGLLLHFECCQHTVEAAGDEPGHAVAPDGLGHGNEIYTVTVGTTVLCEQLIEEGMMPLGCLVVKQLLSALVDHIRNRRTVCT